MGEIVHIFRNKRLYSGVLSLMVLFIARAGLPPLHAAEVYPEIVVNSHDGSVLHHQLANRSWYPASLTKMMTLLLTFEALDSGKLKLDERLPVSAHAASMPPTRLGVRAGDTLTVEQAMKAVATVSANDVAVVLAERLGKTEAGFARMMTARALALGMTGTRFRNASGLPDSAQMTTARDMAMLAMHILHQHSDRYALFSTRSIRYKGRQRHSTNGFVASYKGADGIKTGFTCGSGYNLVASARRDGVRLIGVVLGAANGGARSARMSHLLNQGFARAQKSGEAPKVARLQAGAADRQGAPPVRLAGGKCGRGRPRAASSYIAEAGNLPGWGILLGIQANQDGALSVIRKARKQLSGLGKSPRPALLKRDFAKGTSWKILMVGLQKKQAGEACMQLIAQAMSCVIQSPERMNSPGYARR